ncbi:MAG TPA: DUF4097 family beta strand repeat-containing protein [Vicinamibacterales bacterium]
MIRRRVVLPLLAPVLALVVLSGCAHVSLTASATDEWTHTYPLESGGEVSIENTNGRVEVEPAEGANVEVRAERVAKASSEEAARELLPRITINEDVKPARVAISTAKMGGVLIGVSFEVRYHVRAPRTAAVKVTNTNGTIVVSSIAGPVEAHGTNGAVNGKSLSGAVDASVVNGSVNIDMASVGSQKISLRATNGGVTLALPDDAKAAIDASCVNGGIVVNGVKIEVVEQTRRRLQGNINGGGTPIELKTVNGGVRIRSRAAAAEGAAEAGKAGEAGERR